MVFYYLWYSNPEYGDGWGNWDDGGQIPPSDIYSMFYPSLGCYSSNQDCIIEKHLEWLHRAGVGVVIISYFPEYVPGGSFVKQNAEKFSTFAGEYGIKICYVIDIYPGRTLAMIKRDIKYLMDEWDSHPSTFKYNGEMMVFVFDPSNSTYGPVTFSLSNWNTMITELHAEGYHPLLLASTFDTTWLDVFDGLYQYDIFSYASSHGSLFPLLSSFCRSHEKLFAPSIGPGFDNSRLVPWTPAILDRNGTTQYDDYWGTILSCEPDFVTIVSFNEWGESTSIEPATINPPTSGYNYQSYEGIRGKTGAEAEMVFIDRTRFWVEHYDTSVETYHPRSNILLNGSFEYNSAWVFTFGSWDYSTSNMNSGDRCLQLDLEGDVWAAWAKHGGIPVKDHLTYRVTFYAKKSPGFAGTPDLLLRHADHVGEDVWISNIPITEVWQQYSLKYYPPSGVENVDLYLHCDGTAPVQPSNFPRGIMYWDDVSFSMLEYSGVGWELY